MLRKFQKAGRYKVIRRHERHKRTFTARVGKREVYLDIFPPKTETIYNVSVGNWRVDLKPVNPRNWQQGRSRATRLTALTRSGGRCEHCGANPRNAYPPQSQDENQAHSVGQDPIRSGPTINSHSTLCGVPFGLSSGNLEVGTVRWNAGCGESRPSGVGSAGEKPLTKR